jgi:hypothetical protein
VKLGHHLGEPGFRCFAIEWTSGRRQGGTASVLWGPLHLGESPRVSEPKSTPGRKLPQHGCTWRPGKARLVTRTFTSQSLRTTHRAIFAIALACDFFGLGKNAWAGLPTGSSRLTE